RSLSLVSKLFPTTNPDHTEPLRTANFITQQDFGGEHTDYINDAVTTNAPDTRSWRRGWGFPILIITGVVLKLIDKEATIRELYEISELGKPKSEPTRTPKFMRLRLTPGQERIKGDGLDFRDKIDDSRDADRARGSARQPPRQSSRMRRSLAVGTR